MTDDELARHLEARANRGDPTGADEVWRAADRMARVRPAARRRWVGAAAVAAAVAALAGTVAVTRDDDGVAPPLRSMPAEREVVIAQSASSLVLFDDCAAVLEELQDQALERVGPYGLEGAGGMYRIYDVAFQGAYTRFGPLDSRESGAALLGQATSETNNQEQGVDEPDLVETDGERLYDVRGGTLRVVDLDSLTVSARLPLGMVNVTGAVLIGERLVVFANEPLSSGRRGEAKVVVLDVSGSPSVLGSVTIDGTLVDARGVDGRVHVVTVSHPTIEFTFPTTGDEASEEAATEANKERIRRSTLADWLPSRTIALADAPAERSQLTDCADIRHPRTFAGFDQTSVLTFDPDAIAEPRSTSVQASSLLVYGSSRSIYTATTEYRDLEDLRTSGRPVSAEPHTDIHRFALGDQVTYTGSGRVAGYVGGQFGMSEHDGHLRVASSTLQASAQSRVTVLRLDPGELVETGVVDGLGPNEQIESVRFVGDRGYVVTYRRTDPLYVIDLADPAAPRLAGELKIPGYSQYLHPIDEGLVLGVGLDGLDSGELRGAALSLFDVRDASAPTRIDLEAFGVDTASKMADDHHAFTWWPDTRTAFVPVGLFAAGHRIEAVRVSDDGLTLVGEVTPSGDGAPAKAAFDRTVVVGDRLLSVSPEGVQVSDLTSLAPIAWVPYP